MLGRSPGTRDALLRLLDLAALVLTLPASYQLHEIARHAGLASLAPLEPVEAYWPGLVLVLLVWGAAAWFQGVYEWTRLSGGPVELARVARALAATAFVALALVFALQEQDLSRLVVGVYFAVALTLLLGNRLLCRVIAHATRGRGYHARRVAVAGSGGLAREVAAALEAHPEWGLAFAGWVLEDGATRRPAGNVLGRIGAMSSILEEQVLDQVIFAVPRARMGRIEAAIEACEELGVDVQICLDAVRLGAARMSVTELDGIPVLAVTRTPTDALALAGKRVIDVVVSAAVLLLTAPLLAATALAIRLESPGPVLFRQRRVGLNGRAFQMLKFRSMLVDAEQRLEGLRARNEMSGPVFKLTHDPRVTPVGRFLRKASIDELPQLWNVLRGEMSLVGPRPPLPSEVSQYQRWQRRRLSVKPGITCTWQVSGRNGIDFEQWMQLDLAYIDNWSLWGDVRICLKTIPAVLSARGAK
jgi:exopolysaccharide biosynthesis polyprenyl glycosylphosphotransferase